MAIYNGHVLRDTEWHCEREVDIDEIVSILESLNADLPLRAGVAELCDLCLHIKFEIGIMASDEYIPLGSELLRASLIAADLVRLRVLIDTQRESREAIDGQSHCLMRNLLRKILELSQLYQYAR